MNLEVIVLAAGKGKRMKSDLPKVLHRLAGRPLLAHVLETVKTLYPKAIHVVCGVDNEMVRRTIDDDTINWVTQTEQLGTSHAVQQALPMTAPDSSILVLYGDVPLIQAETLHELISTTGQSAISLLTARLESPTGYGRILRDGDDGITGIVEERDATAEQLEIREVNTGILVANSNALNCWLTRITNDNDQGEFYLTDVVAHANQDAATIHSIEVTTHIEILGVNSRQELARLERAYQCRQAEMLMSRGVTVLDPDRLDIRGEVQVGRDCVLDINVVLEGPVSLGDRVTIGSSSVIQDSVIGDDVVVHPNCVIQHAVIGGFCRIGPFARIRPGTVLGKQVSVGNFVEVKNSKLDAGAKVNHLSYVGDSTVGRNTNIGAGVITCNYDGARKHRTEIGDEVFVGSNSQLVAPVKIETGATIGAGSTITSDVPERTLAVTRSRQRHLKGWQRPGGKDT